MTAGRGREGEPPDRDPLDHQVERRILDAVRSIRFGAVEVVVHDGRVVQIETKEKIRLEAPK